MNTTLIERYIYDVIHRLPKKDQEEVKKELEANIYDMLDEHASEDEIVQVLSELGDPKLLANQYRTKKLYLISPSNFDNYLHILKIVIPIFMVLGAISGFFESTNLEITSSPSSFGVNMTTNIFENAVDSFFSTFTIITIGFFIYEQSNIKLRQKKPWTVEDLPKEVELTPSTISRVDSIVSIIMSLITAIFAIIFFLDKFSIVYVDYQPVYASTIFRQSFLNFCIPIFVVVLIFALIEATLKLIYKRWTIEVGIASFISCIVSGIAAIAILTYQSPFLKSSILSLENMLHIEGVDVADIITTLTSKEFGLFLIFCCIVITISVCSYIVYKTYKQYQLEKK